MTSSQVEQFATDYQNRFGENLGVVLGALPRPITTTAFANRVELLVELMLGISPRYDFIKDKLSDFQKEQIHLAQLEQAYYMVMTEDYSIISGIDFANGQIVDRKQIEDRIYSNIAKSILEDSGLLYRGLRQPTNILNEVF